MNIPLSAERVRALSQQLGFTTKPAEPLRRVKNKRQSPWTGRYTFCACGQPGTHWVGVDAECDGCRKARLTYCK